MSSPSKAIQLALHVAAALLWSHLRGDIAVRVDRMDHLLDHMIFAAEFQDRG
jgi:hypothetical protein